METNEPSSVERSRLLGASPGIGEATAQRLATAGYKVYGTSSVAPARVWSRVCVQAVLPAATRTEIWGHAGVDVDTLPAVMEVTTWWTRRSQASTDARQSPSRRCTMSDDGMPSRPHGKR